MISVVLSELEYSQSICNFAIGWNTIINLFIDMNIKKRLAPILLGIVCVGLLLSCKSTPPYKVIPAPVTREGAVSKLE